MRCLQILGGVLIAAWVANGLAVASAQGSQFSATSFPAAITAEQEAGQTNQFEVGGSSVKCSTATFSATLAKARSTLTITPDYTGCTTSFGTEASVDNNGCDFVLHAGSAQDESDDVFTGAADLVCPAGQELKLTLGLCTIDIPAQEELEGVTYTNKTEASPHNVTVDLALTAVELKVTNVFLCPLSVSTTTGSYQSKILVKGYEDLAGGKEGSGVGVTLKTFAP